MDTDVAKNEAREAASTAAEKTKEVVASASEQAGELAGAAREQAGQVRAEVAQQGRQVVSQATDKIKEQGEQRTQAVAATVRDWADQTRALAEGRPEDAGRITDYARNAADRAAGVAGTLEERGFDGIVDDVQRFARRRPGVFLLGAAAAGFGIGRLLRASSAGDPGSPGAGAQSIEDTQYRNQTTPPSDPLPVGSSRNGA